MLPRVRGSEGFPCSGVRRWTQGPVGPVNSCCHSYNPKLERAESRKVSLMIKLLGMWVVGRRKKRITSLRLGNHILDRVFQNDQFIRTSFS